ncbi:hypothetical protein HPB50_027560 [Hyalomma asiaticum]|uniref:Uncharacterized protein n=1 Tax=Hyalomma asiaticum TaxID=266040 RepID=A0ACB7T0L8_HYAAI|nr:hypothetical protein HPB50_027560 [Hyalomma asiaticum]
MTTSSRREEAKGQEQPHRPRRGDEDTTSTAQARLDDEGGPAPHAEGFVEASGIVSSAFVESHRATSLVVPNQVDGTFELNCIEFILQLGCEDDLKLQHIARGLEESEVPAEVPAEVPPEVAGTKADGGGARLLPPTLPLRELCVSSSIRNSSCDDRGEEEGKSELSDASSFDDDG